MQVTHIYISEEYWAYDPVAAKKAREAEHLEYNAYWEERERWDSIEESGYNTWCPSGNPDYIGKTMNNDMDSDYCIDSELDITNGYYSNKNNEVTRYKAPAMEDARLAHRAELLKKYLEKHEKK